MQNFVMLTVQLDQDQQLDDGVIFALIMKAADPEHSGITSSKIGILNLDASPCRVVAGASMEMVLISDALTALGFVAERAEGVYVKRGFQALYDRVPKVLVRSFEPRRERRR